MRKNTPSIKVTTIKGANEKEEDETSIEREDVATQTEALTELRVQCKRAFVECDVQTDSTAASDEEALDRRLAETHKAILDDLLREFDTKKRQDLALISKCQKIIAERLSQLKGDLFFRGSVFSPYARPFTNWVEENSVYIVSNEANTKRGTSEEVIPCRLQYANGGGRIKAGEKKK